MMHRNFDNFGASTPKVVTFPLTLEHMESKPVTFKTKKDLIVYCRENGKHSGAL